MHTADQRIVRLGRALLTVPFVTGAASVLRDAGPLPGLARSAGVPYPELATKTTAAAMLVGAVAMGTGVAPMVGGVLLTASLIGATVTVHNFWSPQDAAAANAHRKAFLGNCGLLGAVLAMTAVTWQSQREHDAGAGKDRPGERLVWQIPRYRLDPSSSPLKELVGNLNHVRAGSGRSHDGVRRSQHPA